MRRMGLLSCAGALVVGVGAIRAQTAGRRVVDPASQSAKEIRGGSPYVDVKDEPAPQADRGRTASRGPGSRHRVDPVARRESASRSDLREGGGHRVATKRPSARARGRRALVAGGPEQHQHDRHSRVVGGAAQGAARVGEPQPPALSRTVHNGDVLDTQRSVPLSQSISRSGKVSSPRSAPPWLAP